MGAVKTPKFKLLHRLLLLCIFRGSMYNGKFSMRSRQPCNSLPTSFAAEWAQSRLPNSNYYIASSYSAYLEDQCIMGSFPCGHASPAIPFPQVLLQNGRSQDSQIQITTSPPPTLHI